jgi:hypothetical protein
VRLERLIEALDSEWHSEAEFDALLARLLRVPAYDGMTVPATRVSLDGFNVLQHDGEGRLRKRPGYTVPDRADLEEMQNARLRAAQAREAEEFAAQDRRRAAERDPIREAERQVIRGVIDERLRELGLIANNERTSAVSAGEER